MMQVEEKGEADRRGPRLVLQLKTGVGQAGHAFDAEILNLSTEGMLVRTGANLSIDDPIQVVLPQRGAVGAKVVWFTDDMYGCSFLNPISEDELEAANDLAAIDESGSRPRFGVDHETLGQRIKRLRMADGVSMRAFAEQIGVSKPTLWKWEGDQVRPRHETMQRLASRLGVTELELVYGAPGRGAAMEGDDSNASLADIVRASRQRIARAAGVDPSKVEIAIDWGSE